MSNQADDAKFVVESMTRVSDLFTKPDKSGYTADARVNLAKLGHPKAACWDNGPRSDDVWCTNHQQEVHVCHDHCMPCVGVPLSGPSDPTGEAAIRMDTAAKHEKEIKKRLARMRDDADWLELTLSMYPVVRSATAYELGLTVNWNDPHCESCKRMEGPLKGEPAFVQPLTDERTTVTGKLPSAQWLCRWCYDHVVSTGIVPNDDELEQHRAGKRIRCPHPKVEAKEDAA